MLDGHALELIAALDNLSKVCRRQESHEVQRTQGTPREHRESTALVIHQLSQFPNVQNLISSWYRFQASLGEATPSLNDLQALEEWKLKEDETFLSLIDYRLRKFREQLLKMRRSALPAHIDEIDFMAFVERYNFACRFLDCGHEYDCEKARDRHELTHTILFPCLQCDFSGRGFRTRKQLEQHNRTYHTAQEDFQIPQSLAAVGSYGGTQRVALGVSNGRAQKSRCWNEKGRKFIQQTFQKVLSRVKSDMTVMDTETEEQESDPGNRRIAQTSIMVSLRDVRARIDAQQYETVARFKEDLYQALDNPETITISDSFKGLEDICKEEIKKSTLEFHDFANYNDQVFSPNESQATSMSTKAIMETFGSVQAHKFDLPKPYWSVTEEEEFDSLVRQHGRDLEKIADFLMTKSPQDVGIHLEELVRSGREDLARSADEADARKLRDGGIMAESRVASSTLPESEHDKATSELAKVTDSSTSQNKDIPTPFVVRPDELLNYRKQTNPTANGTAKPQIQAPSVGKSTKSGESKRRPPPRRVCPYCEREFRDEYAVIKHIERLHEENRKVWVCEDVSHDKKFLANCKSCSKHKRYSTRHNVFKHLRVAHFPATTSTETLLRWVKETEGPNPNSDKKHSEWLKVNHPERLPAHWQASKRQKTAKDALSTELSPTDTQNSQSYLPPIQDHPSQTMNSSEVTTPLGYKTNDTSLAATPDPSQESSQPASLSWTGDFLPNVSFDNLLPYSSATESDAHNPSGLGIQKALIRPDHVPRLPHLNHFERAACQDQVEALYATLNNEPPSSPGYEAALQRLKSLSIELIKGVRLWRQRNTFAPSIPFSL